MDDGFAALSTRQEMVLRGLVAAYVGEVTPVGSRTVAGLLPVNLSAASVRNTMAELTDLGLIEKPHRSAGRVPTERGLRVFVDRLLDPHWLGRYEKRDLAGSLDQAGPEAMMRTASQLLSDRTRQLGFVVPPRLECVPLRRVSLVRLSRTRVLAVLVTQTGVAHRRVIADADSGGQPQLDRIATALNQWVAGRTLAQVRRGVAGEAVRLRASAGRLFDRALRVARRALASEPSMPGDLVIATRLVLLEQPEFDDPKWVRQLFAALETRELLVAVLDKMIDAQGVRVTFGGELDEPDLRRFALVAAPYGEPRWPLGVVGVIGPSRMDYARVIPLVDYLSRLVTERLCA